MDRRTPGARVTRRRHHEALVTGTPDPVVASATTTAVEAEDAERAGDMVRASVLFRRASTLYAFLARTRDVMRNENAVSAVSLALRGGDVEGTGRLLAEFWDAESATFSQAARDEFQAIGRILRRPSEKDHVEEGHSYWWQAERSRRAGHKADAQYNLMVAALHYAVAFLSEAPSPTCETSSLAASAVIAAHRAGHFALARKLADRATRLVHLSPLAMDEIRGVLREIDAAAPAPGGT